MVGIHLLRQHRTQQAPSWKGLHTLVVQPPNVGKGYAIVMSESHHEADTLHKVVGKSKKVGVSSPFKPIDKSKPSSSSKIAKANKLKLLEIFGHKKIIQEKGMDLDSCSGSFVHKVIVERNWSTWLNMLGTVNDTMVREFYHEYKERTTLENALLGDRGVVFRVNSKNLNDFLEFLDDIESDFLDIDVFENLNEMGRTLYDNDNFEWGKRAFIRQTKGVKEQDNDVLLPPLKNFSDKRMATMSYKEKGKSCDTFRLFGESYDSSLVSSTTILPNWAMQLKSEVVKSRRLIEESQRKIEDLNAKVMLQDVKIKELESKAFTQEHYVRLSNRTTFLSGITG
ncbi:hypothetical protein QYF36_005212 [Acer negundo]|nr:hypothetical protein QYF36_005212 [Acer negundo]